MLKLLTNLTQNRHTSIAGLVYLVAKFGTELAMVWFPQHADKLKGTANIVEGFAVAYGLLAAGDASKGLSKQEADTTFVKRTDAPQPS